LHQKARIRLSSSRHSLAPVFAAHYQARLLRQRLARFPDRDALTGFIALGADSRKV
jgi:hypothetical protein